MYSEGLAVPAPRVTPVVLPLNDRIASDMEIVLDTSTHNK